MAPLNSADAGRRCVSRHEEPLDGATDFSAPQKSDPDSHLSLCAGLSPPGSHRASVLAGGDSQVVVEPPTTTQHASGRDCRPAHYGWSCAENSESHNPRATAPPNLLHASPIGRDYETGQNLAHGGK